MWFLQFCMDCKKKHTRKGEMLSDNSLGVLLLVPDCGRASSHVSSDTQPFFCCAEPAEVEECLEDLHILEVFVAYGLFCIAVVVFVANALALAVNFPCHAISDALFVASVLALITFLRCSGTDKYIAFALMVASALAFAATLSGDDDSYGCQTAHVIVDTAIKFDDDAEEYLSAGYNDVERAVIGHAGIRYLMERHAAIHNRSTNSEQQPPAQQPPAQQRSGLWRYVATTVGSGAAENVQKFVYSLPLVIAMTNSESHLTTLAFAGCASVFNTVFIPFVRDTISDAAFDPAGFYTKVEQESLRWWQFVYDTASEVYDFSKPFMVDVGSMLAIQSGVNATWVGAGAGW